jgi:hypothetical protein
MEPDLARGLERARETVPDSVQERVMVQVPEPDWAPEKEREMAPEQALEQEREQAQDLEPVSAREMGQVPGIALAKEQARGMAGMARATEMVQDWVLDWGQRRTWCRGQVMAVRWRGRRTRSRTRCRTRRR